MIKKILFLTIFLLFLARVSYADNIQVYCENLLSKDRIKGSIIVYDVDKDKIIAATSPSIALKNYYPMGSVFKIITSFAAYKEGLINIHEVINCGNYYKAADRVFRCTKPGGHGQVDLSRAVAYSCSIYFYKLYPELSTGKLIKYSRLMLDNNEHKCKIGNPADSFEGLNMMIGESVFVKIKPVQMITLIKHLIKEDLDIDNDYYTALKNGMELSCVKGTSQRINFNAAGKTGTSTDMNHNGRFHGWFAGWAPAGKPKIAVAVFLDNGKGFEAAEIAGKVFKYCLK
ncbi:MAG: penicillin-binding transpeptidase domain-containing protein [Armatimonadota bacterium]